MLKSLFISCVKTVRQLLISSAQVVSFYPARVMQITTRVENPLSFTFPSTQLLHILSRQFISVKWLVVPTFHTANKNNKLNKLYFVFNVCKGACS